MFLCRSARSTDKERAAIILFASAGESLSPGVWALAFLTSINGAAESVAMMKKIVMILDIGSSSVFRDGDYRL
jgi:hypothetical protein